MTGSAKYSVVIPCFNAAAYITATLESVSAQGLDALEVIVVDDGSTDGTAQAASHAFPSARIARTENRGPSQARNLGTQLAKGEFIQYLDADDLLGPGKIQAQAQLLEADSAEVAYGAWQRFTTCPDGSIERGDVVDRHITNPEVDLFTDFWCPPAAYLFRRSIVERIGGWNESLPVIQDARFVLDCALHGARFVRCPGLMALYRVHTTGSVSTRDPAAFNRDVLHNAEDVHAWWEDHGGITEERRQALTSVYGYVARASFERDRPTFDAACAVLERLAPGYIPSHPRHLAIASRLVGYRRAEHVALWYRRAKDAAHPALRRLARV